MTVDVQEEPGKGRSIFQSRAVWLEIAFALCLLIVGFAIRGYDLSVLIAAPDELTYASRSIHILAANWSWQAPYMWDQPPLLAYLLAVMMAVSGATLNSLRLLSVLCGALSVVLAYFLGKSMYGKKAGVVASIALLVDGYDILYSRQIYIEALATMLILGAVLFFWEGVVKRRSTKLTIIGGIIFGLALDAKYIALVMAVAIVLFLIIYWNKFNGKFPWRGIAIYFGMGFAAFLPVLGALWYNNVNPFYYDLVYRFQYHTSSALVGQIRSGQLFFTGLRNFIQVFFHVSSTDPFQVFPLLSIDIPIWTAIVACVLGFFIVSFFLRRSPADGLLLILFLAFLGFAFTYPDRRTYFALYPSIIFLVMLGRVIQLCVESLRRYWHGKSIVPYVAVAVIALTVSGVALSAYAVPLTYQTGFGDWDELTPILNYVSNDLAHSASNNNTYVAISLGLIGYYIQEENIPVSIAYMRQPQSYYTEPPLNQTLQTPTRGTFPIYWVISTSAIEHLHPEFIIMPLVDYRTTTVNFHTYINERYYTPLSTVHILLFQLRPGNESNFNGTCC